MSARDNPLSKFTAPADGGAGFAATREGSLAMLTPLTPSARSWLRANVADEACWLGDSLAVELRYFPPLANPIIAAGFTFERDAYPN